MEGSLVILTVLSTLMWQTQAATPVNETALIDAFTNVPSCGQTCILSSITKSECQTVANTTCLCNSQQVLDLTLDCLLSSCNTTDALLTAKLETQACSKPKRDKRPDLLAPMSIGILGFLCVITRLYSRWRFTPRYELDDWIMLFCAILYIPFEIIGHYTGQMAFGRDIWEVDIDTLTYGFLLFYIDESFYLAILSLTKISILLFSMRIFPQQGFRRACIACIAWIAASGLAFLFMQIFQCWPLDFIWLGWKGGYKGEHTCLNVHALTYSAAAFGIAQDIVILILPIPLLTQLHASKRKRSQILFMFSLGFFVLLTSCIRLGFIVRFAASWNPTWDYTGPLIWSGLEVGVSMIVTSLPAIRVLLSRTFPGIFGSSQGTARSNSLPMDLEASSKRGTDFVKSHMSMSNQWTPIESRDGTRLQDEEDDGIELSSTTTRIEIKPQTRTATQQRHLSIDIRGSVLSTFSRYHGS